MFLSILAAALKGMFCFTGSYSNNLFPEPLNPSEEDKYIKEMLDRIIMDEKRHLEIFNYLYDGLCKSNV